MIWYKAFCDKQNSFYLQNPRQQDNDPDNTEMDEDRYYTEYMIPL